MSHEEVFELSTGADYGADSGRMRPAKTDTPPADTNDGSTAGQTGGKLVVYSALNEDNTITIADQFKKDTGIEIEYISLGGGDAVAVCRQRWAILRRTFW